MKQKTGTELEQGRGQREEERNEYGKIYFVMGKSASGKDTIYKKLLERIPLPPDIMNALCFREGPLSSWLGLAEALERGDLRQASGLLARIGCSRLETVSAKYQEAHEFAQY